MENDEYRKSLQSKIEEAYLKSGNKMGWRLLASPAAVLDEADVAFLGLNPGGNVQRAEHGELSMLTGSAYVVESWGNGLTPGQSPLQKQVRALFGRLNIEPDKVLAGNLIPFRSPSWAHLDDKEAALRFGESIWRVILERARPRLVICMGSATYASLSRILGATDAETVRVGWGSVGARRAAFKGGILVGLPHLSRFGIMTRPQSEAALRQLFREDWSP